MEECKKIKSQIDNEASKNYYFPFNFESFKKVYKKDNTSLKSFSKELFSFINGLDYDYLKNTRFVNLNYKASKEELFTEVTRFILSLNDKDIINAYASFFANDLDKLEFTNDKSEYYGGSSYETDTNTRITLVIDNKMDDFSKLAHEFGHYIQSRLFRNNLNKLVKYSLIEISSYYFELLMMHSLDKNSSYVVPEGLLINNKLQYFNRLIWDLHLGKFIASLNEYDSSLINNYSISNLKVFYDNETLKRLRIHDLVTSTNYLTSFMIASKLYVDTLNNQEKGLNEYKELMTSNKDKLEDFLNYGNVNFLEDNSSYELLKQKSQIAYKKLVR
ncbi:MAG: hypothetical protein IJS56_06355 [Bacilli bacterium]|nr:hypothetical protein [Bacilli bacterium]